MDEKKYAKECEQCGCYYDPIKVQRAVDRKQASIVLPEVWGIKKKWLKNQKKQAMNAP